MFNRPYIILGQLWTQVASVHHEYGRLTLATAGLLFSLLLLIALILMMKKKQ